MELLINSPLFVPYCLSMCFVWLEAYCHYLQLREGEPLLYERFWYKLVIFLCNAVSLVTFLILLICVSWHALTITLIFIPVFIMILCPLLIGKRESYVIRSLAALSSLIVSVWLVVHWFQKVVLVIIIFSLMQKFILSVLVLFAFWGRSLPLVELVICMVVSCFLCDIDPNLTYSWYAGIWHGLFFLPNWMWSGFGDTLYKAEYYTDAYNIFWWLFSILSTLFVAWLYNIVGTIRAVFSILFKR